MNNHWNKVIYKLWSSVYDTFFNADYFLAARKKVFQGMAIDHQQKVLFVGVGTGADLELMSLDGLEIPPLTTRKICSIKPERSLKVRRSNS